MEQEARGHLWQPRLQSTPKSVFCGSGNSGTWWSPSGDVEATCFGEGGAGTSEKTGTGQDSVVRPADRGDMAPGTAQGQLAARCGGGSERSIEDGLSTRSNTSGSLLFVSGHDEDTCQTQGNGCGGEQGKGAICNGGEAYAGRVKQERMQGSLPKRDVTHSRSQADRQTQVVDDSEQGGLYKGPALERRDVGGLSEERDCGDVGSKGVEESSGQGPPVSADCYQRHTTTSTEVPPFDTGRWTFGSHGEVRGPCSDVCFLSSEGGSTQFGTARDDGFSTFASGPALLPAALRVTAVPSSPVGPSQCSGSQQRNSPHADRLGWRFSEDGRVEQDSGKNSGRDQGEEETCRSPGGSFNIPGGSRVKGEGCSGRQEGFRESELVCLEPAQPVYWPRDSSGCGFHYSSSVTPPSTVTAAETESRVWSRGPEIPHLQHGLSLIASGGPGAGLDHVQGGRDRPVPPSGVDEVPHTVESRGQRQTDADSALGPEAQCQTGSRCLPGAPQGQVADEAGMYVQDKVVVCPSSDVREGGGFQSLSSAYGLENACISSTGLDCVGRAAYQRQSDHIKASTTTWRQENRAHEGAEAGGVTVAGESVSSGEQAAVSVSAERGGGWAGDSFTLPSGAPPQSVVPSVIPMHASASLPNVYVPKQRPNCRAETEGYNTDTEGGGQLRYVLLFPDEDDPLQSSRVYPRGQQEDCSSKIPSQSLASHVRGLNGAERRKEAKEGKYSDVAEALGGLISRRKAHSSGDAGASSNGRESPGECFLPEGTTTAAMGAGDFMRRSSHQSTSASEMNGSSLPSIDGRDGETSSHPAGRVVFRSHGRSFHGEKPDQLYQFSHSANDQYYQQTYSHEEERAQEVSASRSCWQCPDVGDAPQPKSDMVVHQESWQKCSERQVQRSCPKRKRPHTQFQKSVGPVWSAGEDEKLAELVAKQGFRWAFISTELSSLFGVVRTGKQCRERWCNHVNPNVKRGDWSPDEDSLILELQRRIGNRWATIAKQLPGRTENAVKNRFISLKNVRMSNGRPKRPDAPATCSAQSSAGPRAGAATTTVSISSARVVYDATDGETESGMPQTERGTPQALSTPGASEGCERQPAGHRDSGLSTAHPRSASLSGDGRAWDGAGAGFDTPFTDVQHGGTALEYRWEGINAGTDCCKRENSDSSNLDRHLPRHTGPTAVEPKASDCSVRSLPSHISSGDFTPLGSQMLEYSDERAVRIKREREWVPGEPDDGIKGERGGRPAGGPGTLERDTKRGRVSSEDYQDSRRDSKGGVSGGGATPGVRAAQSAADQPPPSGQFSFPAERGAGRTQAAIQDTTRCTHFCSQLNHDLQEQSTPGLPKIQACEQRWILKAEACPTEDAETSHGRVPYQAFGQKCSPESEHDCPPPPVKQGARQGRYTAVDSTTTSQAPCACSRAHRAAACPLDGRTLESFRNARGQDEISPASVRRPDSSAGSAFDCPQWSGSHTSAAVSFQSSVVPSGKASEADEEASPRLLRACDAQRNHGNVRSLLPTDRVSEAGNGTSADMQRGGASRPPQAECVNAMANEKSWASGEPEGERPRTIPGSRIKAEAPSRGTTVAELRISQEDCANTPSWEAKEQCQGQADGDCITRWLSARQVGQMATDDRGAQTPLGVVARGGSCENQVLGENSHNVSQSATSPHGQECKGGLEQASKTRLPSRTASGVPGVRENVCLTGWIDQSSFQAPRHSESPVHGFTKRFPEELLLRRSLSAEVSTTPAADVRSGAPPSRFPVLQRARSLEHCPVSLPVALESSSGIHGGRARNWRTNNDWRVSDGCRGCSGEPGRSTAEVSSARIPGHARDFGGNGEHPSILAPDTRTGNGKRRTPSDPVCASPGHVVQPRQSNGVLSHSPESGPSGPPHAAAPASSSLLGPAASSPREPATVRPSSEEGDGELQRAADFQDVFIGETCASQHEERDGSPADWVSDPKGRRDLSEHASKMCGSSDVRGLSAHDHAVVEPQNGGSSNRVSWSYRSDVFSPSHAFSGSYCVSPAAGHPVSTASEGVLPPQRQDHNVHASLSKVSCSPATGEQMGTEGRTPTSAPCFAMLDGSGRVPSQQCKMYKAMDIPVSYPSQSRNPQSTRDCSTVSYAGSQLGQCRQGVEPILHAESGSCPFGQQQRSPERAPAPGHQPQLREGLLSDAGFVCLADQGEVGDAETGKRGQGCFAGASLASAATGAMEFGRFNEPPAQSIAVSSPSYQNPGSVCTRSRSIVSSSCAYPESAPWGQGTTNASSGLLQPSHVHPEQGGAQQASPYHYFSAQVRQSKSGEDVACLGTPSQGASVFWTLSSRLLAQGEAFPSASVRCLLPGFSLTGFESLGSAFQLLLVDEESHSQRKWGKQEVVSLQNVIREEVGLDGGQSEQGGAPADVRCKRCYHADSGTV